MTLGVAMAVGAASCYGMSNVCYGRLRGVPLPHAVCATLAWNVLLLSMALVVRDGPIGALRGVPAAAWVLFIVVGLMTSLIGRWGLLFCIARIGPSRASTMKNAAPVFSVTLGVALFGQQPTALGLVGIAAIIFGVWLLGREGRVLDVAAALPPPRWTTTGRLAAPRYAGAVRLAAEPRVSGLIVGVLVAVTFAVADSVRLYALEALRDPLVGTWIGSSASLVVAYAWARTYDRRTAIETGGGQRLRAALLSRWVAVAGLASALGFLANFEAIDRLYVAYVTALLAWAPIATAVIGRVVSPGHEVLGRTLLASMATVVTGTILLVVAG